MLTITAVTLWEPWASLMAWGEKDNETRHWPTQHRGWIAIHAAARPVDWDLLTGDAEIDAACGRNLGRYRLDWEFGYRKVLCLRYLEDCFTIGCQPVQNRTPDRLYPRKSVMGMEMPPLRVPGYDVVIPPAAGDKERAFGDYSAGRWAWHCSHLIALPPQKAPVAVGRQGLWQWSVPEETEQFLWSEVERLGLPPLDRTPATVYNATLNLSRRDRV